MKFRKLKKNNKGFSLVELIISVVILGFVVFPLLQAFTTSAMLTSKSRKIGEATAAAQNIQESIESVSVANMLPQAGGHITNQNALDLLGVTSEDTEILNSQSLFIRNLISGNETFNAKVEFRATSAINNNLIAQYTDMTGTFSQPYGENQNPDMLADNAYELKFGNRERYKAWKLRKVDDENSVYREREIKVVVESENVSSDINDGYIVFADVQFVYTYYYFDLNNPSTNPRKFKYTETYTFFPDGYHIKSYDEQVACYLMYYPFLEPYLNGEHKTEKINISIDEEKKDYFRDEKSDLKFKLFLVKQWPIINGVPVKGDHDHDLMRADKQYQFEINEVHNDRYINNLYTKKEEYIKEHEDEKDSYVPEDMLNVYTNANIFLLGKGSSNYTYLVGNKVKKVYINEESKAKNQLVKTEQENRFYNVTITVLPDYVEPDDVETEEELNSLKIYQLKASKLK